MTSSFDQTGPIVRAKIEAIKAAGGMAHTSLQGTFTPEQLVFTLPPSRSHILWLAGHMAYATDGLTALVTHTPVTLPAHYLQLFGRGSQPVADFKAYPPFDEVLAAFDQAFAATVERALALVDDDLARKLPEEVPVAKRFPTVGDVLTGVVLHTAYHSGQIAILRRAQGLPSGLGV